jgi:hypothetical protein
MANFINYMHDIYVLPICHAVGYRQIIIQDTLNIFNKGHNAIFLHTSPHKQYYLYLAPSFQAWLEDHNDKLINEKFLI